MREENEWLDALAVRLLARCAVRGDPAALSADRLKRHRLAARRRVLRLWLVRGGMEPEAVDFDAVDALDRLLREQSGTRFVSLPGGWRAVRRYGRMSLEREAGAAPGAFRVRLLVRARRSCRRRASGHHEVGRGVIRQAGAGIGELPAEASLGRGPRPARRSTCARGGPATASGRWAWPAPASSRPLCGPEGCRGTRGEGCRYRGRGEIAWLPGYRVARGWRSRTRPAPPCTSSYARSRSFPGRSPLQSRGTGDRFTPPREGGSEGIEYDGAIQSQPQRPGPGAARPAHEGMALWLLLLALFLVVFQMFSEQQERYEPMPYNPDFVQRVERGTIRRCEIVRVVNDLSYVRGEMVDLDPKTGKPKRSGWRCPRRTT